MSCIRHGLCDNCVCLDFRKKCQVNLFFRGEITIDDVERPSLAWSYGSWIYNYICNQCLSPLKLWVRIPLRRGVIYTKLCDKVYQWLTTGRWFSPVSSTNRNIVESGVKHHSSYPMMWLFWHGMCGFDEAWPFPESHSLLITATYSKTARTNIKDKIKIAWKITTMI